MREKIFTLYIAILVKSEEILFKCQFYHLTLTIKKHRKKLMNKAFFKKIKELKARPYNTQEKVMLLRIFIHWYNRMIGREKQEIDKILKKGY